MFHPRCFLLGDEAQVHTPTPLSLSALRADPPDVDGAKQLVEAASKVVDGKFTEPVEVAAAESRGASAVRPCGWLNRPQNSTCGGGNAGKSAGKPFGCGALRPD